MSWTWTDSRLLLLKFVSRQNQQRRKETNSEKKASYGFLLVSEKISGRCASHRASLRVYRRLFGRAHLARCASRFASLCAAACARLCIIFSRLRVARFALVCGSCAHQHAQALFCSLIPCFCCGYSIRSARLYRCLPHCPSTFYLILVRFWLEKGATAFVVLLVHITKFITV